MFPVYRLNINKQAFDPPPLSPGAINLDPVTHIASTSEGESQDNSVNTDCFNDYDPSLLGNIDPDINYLNSNKKVLNTPYYNDQSFSRKFHSNNDSLSMLHLNIRSIPDHFLQLTSLLNNLNVELKIVAISETWIKPFHINYNIPNYNIEQEFRLQTRGGGVCLYLHSVIQYKLRNDLKLGNDPELVNSVFVEIEKSTIGTKKKSDCWLHNI